MAVIVAVPAGRVGAGTADAGPKATTGGGGGGPVTGDACTAEVLADAGAVRIDTTGGPDTAGRGPEATTDATTGATIRVEMVAATMPRRSVCTRSCYHVGWSAPAHASPGGR